MIRRRSCAITSGAIVALTFLVCTVAWAATENLLHTFAGGPGGASPLGTLILDGNGNVYGTTQFGGIKNTACPNGCGTVYELIPGSNGQWTETVLHTFTGGTGGAQPLGGLISDGTGDLYGTTSSGGTSTNCPGGCGTVFELTPATGGNWTWHELFSFNGTGGQMPVGRLALDGAGNLYGVTAEGGGATACTEGCGTVYALVHNSDAWTWKGLHIFSGIRFGTHPMAGLVLDNLGNLYGTTVSGGINCNGAGCGTVFELMRGNGGAQWTLRQLHAFAGPGSDSDSPQAELVFDATGNLYGTTSGASQPEGCSPCGTAFELIPAATGPWAEHILRAFLGTLDGGSPQAPLISDGNGNLFGTTTVGGSLGGGTIFELVASSSTRRPQLRVLHSFRQAAPNPGGSVPGGLVFDPLGNLYGPTLLGGSANDGIVFQLTP
jgi:uncharacterized repeat protein (TIGR03803 family)